MERGKGQAEVAAKVKDEGLEVSAAGHERRAVTGLGKGQAEALTRPGVVAVQGEGLWEDARELHDRLGAMILRAETEKPTMETQIAFLATLRQLPEMQRHWEVLSEMVQHRLLKKFSDNELRLTMLQAHLTVMRQELGFETASMLERMMIETIVTDWVWLTHVQTHLSSAQGADRVYWEQRVAAAEKRWVGACEALLRMRKLMKQTPALQINIGQQQMIGLAGERTE